MSYSGLQALIGRAIVDSAFRKQLLTSPADILDELPLSSEEREIVLAIRANSLPDFAAQLDEWFVEEQWQEGAYIE